jgi:hypothetical protein
MQHISGIPTQLLATKRPHLLNRSKSSKIISPSGAKQLLAPAPKNIQYEISAVAFSSTEMQSSSSISTFF